MDTEVPASLRRLFRTLLILIFLGSVASNVSAQTNLIWSHSLPTGLTEQTGTLNADSTLVVVDGVIALGTAPCPRIWACPTSGQPLGPQTFWALDANTGHVKWTIPLANGSVIEPIAGYEKFVLAQYESVNAQGEQIFTALALDSQTGRIIWSNPNATGVLAGNLILRSDVTTSNNWNNATITDATLTAYDPMTGLLAWKIHTFPTYYSWGTSWDYGYGAGILFTVAGKQTYPNTVLLSALNASTGAEMWVREGFASGSCPRYKNGIVFATQQFEGPTKFSSTERLVALDATTGLTLWNKTVSYSYYGTTQSYYGANQGGAYLPSQCPIVGEDAVFAFSNKGYNQTIPDLVALSPTDGRELWRQPVPCEVDPIDLVTCRPALWSRQALSESMLFIASGYLNAIDQNSGKVVWSYGLTVDNWNPLLYQDGVLYTFNTPSGSTPPTIAAFEFTGSPIPEMPLNPAAEIQAIALLTIPLITRMSKPRKLVEGYI
jgi:outer membrane protein assembly factor BamB